MGKAKEKPRRILKNSRWSGISQLTLVEHSLCPLEPPDGGFQHEASYFIHRNGKRQATTAMVDCPLGLHPKDERTLWRLVALAFSAEEPQPKLCAGVRYLLRYLNFPVGGSGRKQLRETIRRLGAVRYRNENFFDPVRKEYRDIIFSFFSPNLPKDDESYRPWAITFDLEFFDFCQVWGGFLGFHHGRYSKFRPATARLMLWVKKLLYPDKKVTPFFDVDYICVNVLGLASSMRSGDQNHKLRRCVKDLSDAGIIELPNGDAKAAFEKKGKGKYRIRFHRGSGFDDTEQTTESPENPAIELLAKIGLETDAIRWVMRKFDVNVINEGADITLARMERGMGFSRSPQAFFVDYVKKRTAGEAAPPDWWRELKKEEERGEFNAAMRKLNITQAPEPVSRKSWEAEFRDYLQSDDGRSEYEQLARDVFGGDSRAAIGELQRRFSQRRRESDGPSQIGNLFKFN